MINTQMTGLCTDTTHNINTVDKWKVLSEMSTMTQIETLDIKENAHTGEAGLGNMIITNTQQICASSKPIAETISADLCITQTHMKGHRRSVSFT